MSTIRVNTLSGNGNVVGDNNAVTNTIPTNSKPVTNSLNHFKDKIPNLPTIEITNDQATWLKEIWKQLLETGNNPDHRTIRLKTMQTVVDGFDPTKIDNRLLIQKTTQITLLGVLAIEPDFKIIDHVDKIIEAIKELILRDPTKEDFSIADVASQLSLDKKYVQIIYSLASMYGNFWSGASSSETVNTPYGYERFSITTSETFDFYLAFKNIFQVIDEYFRKFKAYEEKDREAYEEIDFYPDTFIRHKKLSKNPGLFDPKLFDNTRGYLRHTGNQASLCYQYELYDGSFVLVRKLFETLIIETFERHGISEKIKDSEGNYYFLSNLIAYFLREQKWTLTRSTKHALPELKKLADASAHNKHFRAHKSDIDGLDLRIMVQEIIDLIDYSTWSSENLK